MRILLSGLIALSVIFAATTASAEEITIEQVTTLAKVGLPPADIIKTIERNRQVFELSVRDLMKLKKAGVPENVIRYMLKTPQLFGKGKAARKTVDEPSGVQELTPEERAAMEQKQREEAEKLANEARRAEESQRRAFAQGILRRGMDLANSGEYVESIQTFKKFIQDGGYAPGTDEYYTAVYGIANALEQAGMYQSAGNYLLDVLREGPTKTFFQQAFWKLRTIRQKIDFTTPDIEELANFTVTEFSRKFQNEYNYVLGEFFYDYGQLERSLGYFEGVSDDSMDRAKALYLTGLVQAQNELYLSATRSFQSAITSTESNKSDPEVSDLAYLALARTAYENGFFDVAIYYYRKVPTDSNKLATAFYESAWTYFLKGDYSRALGTFQALHSPYFSHYFFPELWILEATVYVNLCHYDYAREAINRFNRSVNTLAVPLKKLLSALRTPADYYRSFIGVMSGDKRYQIDRRVFLPIMSNAQVYILYNTIQQIEWEEKQLTKVQDKLGPFATDLLAQLASQRGSRVNEAGIRIQQVLKQDVEAELKKYSVKVTEINVDLDVQEIEREDAALKGVESSSKETTAAEQSGEGGLAIVGSDSMAWPFDGEYWRDEIGGFRSSLLSKCTDE
jgi:tetratricopeptide (TPR) repeat protein